MSEKVTRTNLETELGAMNNCSGPQPLSNGDRIEQEEFEEICVESRVHPSPCCAPKYCGLAPFHEIDILREAMRINRGALSISSAIKQAEMNVLAKRRKKFNRITLAKASGK
jgi:hypothetical protein